MCATGLISFTQKLTSLRHKYPVLRRNRFLMGDYNEALDVRDVTWINASGDAMTSEQWSDAQMHCFGMLIDGRAQTTGIKRRGQDATFLLILNAHSDLVEFVLPAAADARAWLREFDTNDPHGVADAKFDIGTTYGVTGGRLCCFGSRRIEPARDAPPTTSITL